MYSLECKTCKGKYIGETQRALAVREKERRDAVRLGNTGKSAVAEHVVQHEIDWSSVRIVDGAVRRTGRKMREAFAINQTKPVMSCDAGMERSKTWSAIL